MKVYVRHGENELMFPSFKELQTMYRLKFVGPDDLIRRETSEQWVRAGDMPELKNDAAEQKSFRQITAFFWLMLGAFAVAMLIKLFLLSSHR